MEKQSEIVEINIV